MKSTSLSSKGIVISALCYALSGAASAQQGLTGTVNFLGTTGEFREANGVHHARFRFRVIESVCGSDQTPKERWVLVKSGRMDGDFQHNSANFRNAYNTVMSALLARTVLSIQLDVPDCDATRTQEVNLPSGAIGLFPK
jgi:hypothetical protein